MQKFNDKLVKFGNFLFDNRFKIALIIFFICIIFKINGSSLGLWNSLINTGISPKLNILFGISRSVRSDEFAVLTPMFFGQVNNGFHYFNTAFRAVPTDVFMIYSMPVLSIFQIYRPFLIGFIILGASRGLAFSHFSRNFFQSFSSVISSSSLRPLKNLLLP